VILPSQPEAADFNQSQAELKLGRLLQVFNHSFDALPDPVADDQQQEAPVLQTVSNSVDEF
jgi:hypothetical protein